MMASEELFKPGDLVKWRYTREDWPYTDGNGKSLLETKYEETIGYELKNAEPPPYKVERVLTVRGEDLDAAGHPQIIGVLMVPTEEKLKRGTPNPDLRHFSGSLLIKVNRK